MGISAKFCHSAELNGTRKQWALLGIVGFTLEICVQDIQLGFSFSRKPYPNGRKALSLSWLKSSRPDCASLVACWIFICLYVGQPSGWIDDLEVFEDELLLNSKDNLVARICEDLGFGVPGHPPQA